jgi:hypothetical protein
MVRGGNSDDGKRNPGRAVELGPPSIYCAMAGGRHAKLSGIPLLSLSCDFTRFGESTTVIAPMQFKTIL